MPSVVSARSCKSLPLATLAPPTFTQVAPSNLRTLSSRVGPESWIQATTGPAAVLTTCGVLAVPAPPIPPALSELPSAIQSPAPPDAAGSNCAANTAPSSTQATSGWPAALIVIDGLCD